MTTEKRLSVHSLDLLGARLFAVACACRVQGVIGYFGRPETKRESEAILKELWKLAVSTGETRLACEGLLELLEACPEASIDDPYRRGYYAMRALGVLSDAVSTVGAETALAAVKCATDTSNGIISLAADIEFEVSQANNEIEAPSGESEAEFHAQLIRLVEPTATRSVERVRLACEQEAWPVEALRIIDAAHGWVRLSPR